MVGNDSNNEGKLFIAQPVHVDTVVLAEGSQFELNIHRYHYHADGMSQIINALVEEIISLNKKLKKAGIE